MNKDVIISNKHYKKKSKDFNATIDQIQEKRQKFIDKMDCIQQEKSETEFLCKLMFEQV